MIFNIASPQVVPLHRHRVIDTDDLTVAENLTSRFAGAHRFASQLTSRRWRLVVACARLNRLRVFGIRFWGDMVTWCSPSQFLRLAIPLHGELIARRGMHEIHAKPGHAILQMPCEELSVEWHSNCSALVISLDCGDWARLATAYPTARLPSALKPVRVLDLQRGAGSSIARAVAFIVSELEEDESSLTRGATTQAVEDLLLTSVMHGASIDASPENSTPKLALRHSSLGRALDFIETHLLEQIRLADVCDAAGSSRRKLQYEFAREFGMGPVAWLRNRKLLGARAELQAATTQVKIADVAARWGFLDPQYFARVYLATFGERPSDTLKR